NVAVQTLQVRWGRGWRMEGLGGVGVAMFGCWGEWWCGAPKWAWDGHLTGVAAMTGSGGRAGIISEIEWGIRAWSGVVCSDGV
ncbi:hypothetical protein B1218_37280, partial [Pseudomonas ogarae]